MSTIDIDELERLEKEATPGEWRLHLLGKTLSPGVVFCGETQEPDETSKVICERLSSVSDMQLVTISRNALPELLRLARDGQKWRQMESNLADLRAGKSVTCNYQGEAFLAGRAKQGTRGEDE